MEIQSRVVEAVQPQYGRFTRNHCLCLCPVTFIDRDLYLGTFGQMPSCQYTQQCLCVCVFV
jgi:hypothetical protein